MLPYNKLIGLCRKHEISDDSLQYAIKFSSTANDLSEAELRILDVKAVEKAHQKNKDRAETYASIKKNTNLENRRSIVHGSGAEFVNTSEALNINTKSGREKIKNGFLKNMREFKS